MSTSPTLPPFKIRQLQQQQDQQHEDDKADSVLPPALSAEANNDDGLIHIRHRLYDDQLKLTPDAALRYVDQDDGEVIVVGSSFELDQKLREPVLSPTVLRLSRSRLPGNALNNLVHSFEIQEKPDVMKVWRQIQQDSSKADDKAGTSVDMHQLHFLASNPPKYERQPTLPGEKETKTLGTNDTKETSQGSLTPEGKKHALAAGAAISQSTLRTSQTPLFESSKQNEHGNRWASYGASSSPQEKESMQISSVDSENKSSPSKLELNATTPQPLMEMFEAELAKLVQSSQEKRSDPIPDAVVVESQTSNKSPSQKETGSTDLSKTTAFTESENVGPALTSIQDPIVSSPPSHGEMIGKSLRMAFDSLGMIASTVLEQNPDITREVHKHVRKAQKDVSGHIEKAMRASAEAVDTLRGVKLPIKTPSAEQTSSSLSKAQDSTVTNKIASENMSAEKIISQSRATGIPISSIINEPHPATQACSDGSQLTHGPTANEALKSQSTAAGHDKTKDSKSPVSTFKAQKIIGRRYIHYDGLDGVSFKQYLVRWVGHSSKHDMWYDAENLGGCRRLVEQYEEEHPESNTSQQVRHDLKTTCTKESNHYIETFKIHSRTAGDRMITQTIPKPDIEPPSTNTPTVHKKASPDHFFPRTDLSVKSHDEVMNMDPKFQYWHLQRPNSVIGFTPDASNTRQNDAPDFAVLRQCAKTTARLADERSLRHRKSWHPSTANDEGSAVDKFEFCPAAVMKKYPSIAQFENRSSAGVENYTWDASKVRAAVTTNEAASKSNKVSNYKPATVEDATNKIQKPIEQYYKAKWSEKEVENDPLYSLPSPPSSNAEKSREKTSSSIAPKQQSEQKVRFAATDASIRPGGPPPPPKDKSVRRTKSLAFERDPMISSSSWWKSYHPSAPDKTEHPPHRSATTGGRSQRYNPPDYHYHDFARAHSSQTRQAEPRDIFRSGSPPRLSTRASSYVLGQQANPSLRHPWNFQDLPSSFSRRDNPSGIQNYMPVPRPGRIGYPVFDGVNSSAYANANTNTAANTNASANTTTTAGRSLPGAWPSFNNLTTANNNISSSNGSRTHDRSISDCARKLRQFGYANARAEATAEAARGDLEQALDLLADELR